MRVLLWIVRIYRWWMFGWVLLTWIPGLAGSQFHMLLGWPVLPVLSLFAFLNVGGLWLGPIIPLYGLYMLDRWLDKTIKEREGSAAGQPLNSTAPPAGDYAAAPAALPAAPDVEPPA